MMGKERCQSCGMPLGEGFHGTNADGSENAEYCRYCYKSGVFTMPDLTLERMIDRSVEFMKSKLGLSAEKARALSSSVIPKLKRWRR